GQMLGNYKLGPMLGRGHVGVVFRATDTRTHEPAAVKVISPDFPASSAELQQFVGALKVAPNLQNEHLVALLNAGKSGPSCCIAREYMEGESVAALVARLNESGKFNWKKAFRVAFHLGRVLVFLRAQKVVHGGILPTNILLRSEDKLTLL